MADEEAAQSNESQPTRAPRKKMMVLVVIGAVMLLEGGAIFIAAKMLYKQPETAMADTESKESEAIEAIEREVEITLPEVNAFNKRQGKLMLYNLEMAIRVSKENKQAVERILAARQATILDRLNTVIRSAESKYLSEPGLETLRRQFKQELNRVLGESDLVIELLVRRFFQSPVDM